MQKTKVLFLCIGNSARSQMAEAFLRRHFYWPIEDPAAFEGSEEETLERFRRARDEIAARIEAWLAEPGVAAGG